MDALATVLLLAAPYLLFVAIDRFLPGGDQPISLFRLDPDRPWPLVGHEEDELPWTFAIGSERGPAPGDGGRHVRVLSASTPSRARIRV
jgi:hypothetical protein